MKTLILIVGILISTISYSNTLGYVIGKHIGSEVELNDKHLFLELYDSILLYQNSFDVGSLAIYKSNSLTDHIKVKLGVTTGYYRDMTYKGYKYTNYLATQEGISLFMSITYELDYLLVVIMGNSINCGIKYDF